jgi:hypothetical protein
MSTFSLYGLTDDIREKLAPIAKKKDWSIAKLIIYIIKRYLDGGKDDTTD